MPEYFETISEGIARCLKAFGEVRRLTLRDLTEYKNEFRAGWEVPDVCDDATVRLRILVPALAPTRPVRVAVYPAPPVLTWPHLEKLGLLCLPPMIELASVEGTINAIPRLLDDARILVNASIKGNNTDDFEEEFSSYWSRWDRTTATLNLLCDPKGPSREVAAWRGTQGLFAGENETTVRAWLVNRFGESSGRNTSTFPAPLIWLARAPRPNEYPSTVGALRNLFHENPIPMKLLDAALLRITKNPKLIILGFTTRRGVAFAGLTIQHPAGVENGFRGRAPDDLTLLRYNIARVVGAEVIRLDHSWVHGRDYGEDAAQLRQMKVAVVGVGSVGSGVADLLAKAGIGTILLFDAETIESANSSRHLVGANAIGIGKAKAVAQSIIHRLPHLDIHFSGDFIATSEVVGILQNVHLIICMTGDWPTESLIDAVWRENQTLPPVMYGWTEEHAAAGHAVAFRNRGHCLHCLLDDSGRARRAVTTWPQHTMVDIPACGGSFQPYGATELSHTQALIADLAIDFLMNRTTDAVHRAWIGRRDYVVRTGGTWNQGWISTFGDPGLGGRIEEVPVPHCERCGGVE